MVRKIKQNNLKIKAKHSSLYLKLIYKCYDIKI